MKRFYRAIFYSSILWVICFSVIVHHVIFHPILNGHVSKHLKNGQSRSDTPLQSRHGVSKDLWITSKDARIFCHLESPASSLQYVYTKKNSNLIETLDQLKIWIQEENQVKYLKATNAALNYSDHTLKTYDTYLCNYKTINPDNKIFSGRAETLTISFDNSPLAFSASGFSANLKSGETQ